MVETHPEHRIARLGVDQLKRSADYSIEKQEQRESMLAGLRLQHGAILQERDKRIEDTMGGSATEGTQVVAELNGAMPQRKHRVSDETTKLAIATDKDGEGGGGKRISKQRIKPSSG